MQRARPVELAGQSFRLSAASTPDTPDQEDAMPSDLDVVRDGRTIDPDKISAAVRAKAAQQLQEAVELTPDDLPEYGRPKRSQAKVTADRLRKDSEDFYDQLTTRELDAIERVLLGLDAIDRGER